MNSKLNKIFINAANLYKGNVNNFLGVQPRNILLQIVRKINEYHKVQSHDYIIDYIPPPDQKESNENITKQITNLCFTHSLENVYVMRNYLNLETVTPLYGSISDFLRSVSKKYIKLWLKYFEDYSRGKKFSNVKGGTKYGFLEREISKTTLINIIMDYIEMYPELKTATKFSKIIKTDKTIHKDIINFSSSLEFLYSTASKLDEYRRRKNIQLEYNDFFSNKYEKIEENKDKIIFFIFKILANFPELNNRVLRTSLMNDSLIIENFSVYINKKNRTELVMIAKKSKNIITLFNQ